MRHAVCLTGLERSFAEIGGNIREGLYSALAHSTSVLFGVRPPHDAWASVRALLPLADANVETQKRCWSAAA